MKIINIAKNYQYIFENGKVVKKELSKEKGIVTSFLHPKDFLTITKKFDAHLNKEEMFLEMEKYIYSYPGVDINKEYKSIFIPVKRDNIIVLEAILVEVEKLSEIFSDALNIYKYIDFISPSVLAWKEYYNITKIEPKNDIFIYLDEEEAFLSGFSEGKYIFHKSLNKINTLSKLMNKEIKEVIKILSSKGLDINAYEDEKEFSFVDKFFSEFFLKVFNIINFSINEYHISKFDRIIFYSPFEIKGLFEQYENYWSLNGIEFKKSSISTEYNHFEYLITIFNANHFQEDSINLTIFAKPPSFITTKAGKFFVFLFFCILAIIVYIAYEKYFLYEKKKEIKILERKFHILEKRHNLEVKLVKKYKKEDSKLIKDIKNYKDQIDKISKKIDILYSISKEPLFFNVLAKISDSMKKYSLKAEKLINNNHHITIILISNYDNTQEVTLFMNDLLKFGFKNVKSSFISYSKNFYISKVDFDYE